MTDTTNALRGALARAFRMGETYWSQADSENPKNWKKADETRAKFQAFVEETVAALATAQPEAKPEGVDVALVPREPTEAFFMAMECGPGYEFAASRAMWTRGYHAMVAAAVPADRDAVRAYAAVAHERGAYEAAVYLCRIHNIPYTEITSCVESTKPSASPSPASSASTPASGAAPACAEPAAATATEQPARQAQGGEEDGR